MDSDNNDDEEDEDEFLVKKKGQLRNIDEIEVAEKPLYSKKALKWIKVEGHSKGQNITKFDNDGTKITNLEFDWKYRKTLESLGEVTEGTGLVTKEDVDKWIRKVQKELEETWDLDE